MPERTALITGCSSGFGLGIARALHARSWNVIAGVRDLTRAPAELSHLNVVALDLANETSIHDVAQHIDRLDCLVNNAGYALTGPFSSYTHEQMQRTLNVNVLGPARLTQALLPALKATRGRVINISSMAGEIGIPMNALYSAAKHAIEGLTESLHHELWPHGVQVALVEPGGFRTRFAANLEWGAHRVAAGTIEARQLAAYRALQARMLSGPGRDPAAVVDAVVRLTQMKAMPLRTRVGRDAELVLRLKRWLPESVAVAILARLFRRRMAIESVT